MVCLEVVIILNWVIWFMLVMLMVFSKLLMVVGINVIKRVISRVMFIGLLM